MSKFIRQLLPFASLVLIFVALSLIEPQSFLSGDNISNVLRRCTVNAIMAVGMTAIIVSGGIDLSVGSMMAVSGMAGAWVMLRAGGGDLTGSSMLLGTLVGVATGSVCGLLNGVLITRLKLPPFIVTLGTMSVFRGISFLLNSSQPYDVPDYKALGSAELVHVPVSVLIATAVVVIAALAMRYTPLGRHAYAIGSNREAAFHSGVNVNRNLTALYALSGLLTGLAAMITTSRAVSAQPTAGNGLELDIIAAVVIGGASLSGGRGTILGAVIGTLLIGFLRNGCALLGISTDVQFVVLGVIIIAAVAVDQAARERAK